jgi:hypothetical protein
MTEFWERETYKEDAGAGKELDSGEKSGDIQGFYLK